MTRFNFTHGLLISSILTLGTGLAACSSDDSPAATAGTGGTTSTGGAAGGTGTGGKGGTTSAGGTAGTGTGGKGGATSTGGGTGTGGAKTDGGTDGGGEKPDAEVYSEACQNYCAKSVDLCKLNDHEDAGVHEGYFTALADCLDACGDYPTTGADGDLTGDTLQCRMKHLKNIEDASAADKAAYKILHCPHTGVNPTAFCK